MFKITLPIKVKKSKKKYFHLNLNQYRNAHHRTLSAAKIEFTEQVLPLVKHLPKMGKIRIEYYLFVGSRQSCDVSNVCSVVDKFFQDTLTKAGVLEDDNYKIVPTVSFSYAGYEKDEGRVEAHIIPITDHQPNPEEEETVQLKIVEKEIKKAITMYVNSLGLDTTGKNVEIDLQATRGDDGYTAVIDVTEGSEAPASATKPTPSPAPAKAAASSASAEESKPESEPESASAPEAASADAPEPETQEKSEPAKPQSTGLFGNVDRPRND